MVRDRWIECPITDILLPNGIKIGPFGSQLKKETLIPYGQYKVYGQENVYEKDFSIGDRYLEKEHFDKLSSCEIVPGDFVMSTMGTIGKCAIVPKGINKGIMDSHLVRLRFDTKKILPEYLLHLFSDDFTYLKQQTSRLSVGGIMDGLSVGIVSSLEVSFPESKEEQLKIVNILSETDELIETLEREILKKRNIKIGTIQNLLSGKHRLSGFDKRWNQDLLKDVTVKIGVGLATSVTKYYRSNGTVIFRNLNIKENYLDDSDILFLDEDFAAANPGKIIHTGDVITVHTGYVGTSCVVPPKYDGALTFTTLITTTKKDLLLPEYLSYHLNSIFGKNEIENLQAGCGRNNLNVGDFKQYKISYPSDLDEQKQIVEILSSIDAELRCLEDKLRKTQQVKQGMMNDLLTGKIRLV